jgi:dihydrolipoamide dehydrogenase
LRCSGRGTGPLRGAIRASQLKLKTAIVEKKYWGGVCLNVGCIPSKALLRNAELVHILKHKAKTFGINIEGKVDYDYGEAFRRSRNVADGRVKGVRFLMKKSKIAEYEGWATFKDSNNVDVKLNAGGEETLKFRTCIIATGTTVRLIPGSKLSKRVVTYEERRCKPMSRTFTQSVM